MNNNQSTFSGEPDNNGTGSDGAFNRSEAELPPLDDQRLSTDMQFHFLLVNIATSSVSLMTALAHIPVLVVLKQSKRLPTSFRFLSINFVTCSLLYFVSIFVLAMVFLSVTETYTQIFVELRAMYACALYAASICTVGGMAFERYVRIMYPLVATKMLRKRYTIIYIISAWVLGFLTSFVITVTQCDFGRLWCDITQAVYINKNLFFAIFSLFSIAICFLCGKISRVINKMQIVPHDPSSATQDRMGQGSDNTQAQNRSSSVLNSGKGINTTRYIMKIMITYVVCHVPFLINCIIFLPFPNWRTERSASILQLFSFIGSLVSFFVTTHFFIWKFKQCKLVFLQLFCGWNPRMNDKTQKLKMEVYDIPISTRSS